MNGRELYIDLALFALAVFPVMAVIYHRKKRRLEGLQAQLKALLDSEPVDAIRVYSARMDAALSLDHRRGRITLARTGEGTARAYPLADVMSAEIQEDGETVVSTSSSRSLTGAVLGGALLGGAGMILGGLGGSTKSRERRNVRALDLVVTVADIERPRHVLRLLDAPHGARAESDQYKTARSSADELLATIQASLEIASRP